MRIEKISSVAKLSNYFSGNLSQNKQKRKNDRITKIYNEIHLLELSDGIDPEKEQLIYDYILKNDIDSAEGLLHQIIYGLYV